MTSAANDSINNGSNGRTCHLTNSMETYLHSRVVASKEKEEEKEEDTKDVRACVRACVPGFNVNEG